MQKFSIQNRKGLKIVGEIHIPQSPIGLAFTLHGLGSFKESPSMMALVDTLVAHNYTVVNFDATNSIGESEGKYEDATMQLHYEDLVDVIAWAKTQLWYQEPFILAGSSLGGYAVARYAEDYPHEVKAVFPFALVVAGEFSHQADTLFRFEELKQWKETGWKEEESKSKPGLIKRLPWSHMEERLQHDLRPNVLKLTMPVLLVVGEEDRYCTIEAHQMFFDLLPGKKELYIVPGAPHTFREHAHLEQLRTIFSKWLMSLE